jgi:hypothetical protein
MEHQRHSKFVLWAPCEANEACGSGYDGDQNKRPSCIIDSDVSRIEPAPSAAMYSATQEACLKTQSGSYGNHDVLPA